MQNKNIVSLKLKDNSTYTLRQAGATDANAREVYNILSKLSNKQVSKDIFIFPQKEELIEDEVQKLPFFYLEPANLDASPEELLEKNIYTNNLMGFVSKDNVELNIISRFENEDKPDYFLQYMLFKIFHLNIVDMYHSSKDLDFFEIYVFLFSSLLKKAMSKGIFKTYKTYKYNDSKLKGVFDVSRHIKENIPFIGNVSYKSREYSYDNNVTQLIRHTIEFMAKNEKYSYLLNSDHEIKECIRIIREITPSYNKNQKLSIINKNKKKVRHPYFSEYTLLQNLCILILKKKKIGYTESDSRTYGILFDGSWLWEEYLATIIEENNCGFIHSENRKKTNGVLIYKGNLCYPDFYKRTNSKSENSPCNCVLDAKYQNFENSYKRENIFQIISYMHILPADNGTLIYPSANQENTPVKIIKHGDPDITNTDNLKGLGGNLFSIELKIPSENNIKEFTTKIKQTEKDFIEFITSFKNIYS